MAALLYSATMSLDGFIAGPGGDMSWLTEHLGPNPPVDDLIGRIGALLVGNRSFRVTFVGDLDSGVAAAKAAAGDRYVNVIGADAARRHQRQAGARQPDPRAESDQPLVPRHPIASTP
jgi:hypothetical protein